MTSTQHRHVTPTRWNDVEMECGGCRRIWRWSENDNVLPTTEMWLCVACRAGQGSSQKANKDGRSAGPDYVSGHGQHARGEKLESKSRAGKGFPRRAAEGLRVVIGCLAWMGRVGVGTLERWVRAGLGPWSQNLKIRTLVLCIPGVGFAPLRA